MRAHVSHHTGRGRPCGGPARRCRRLSRRRYRERNLLEHFFNLLKQYRGIASRYDKLANTVLAGFLFVCVVL
jgi:transposase